MYKLTVDEANQLIKNGRTKEEYLKDYFDIINHSKERGLDKKTIPFYTEIHHIQCRCDGGSDSKDNLVALSYLEHLVCHVLLYRSDPNNVKYAMAAACMLMGRGYWQGKDIKHQQEIENYLSNLSSELISELESLRISSISIPVVCHDEEFNVYGIYSTQSEARRTLGGDFSISVAISEGRYAAGKLWSKLEDFEKDHLDKLDYFKSLSEDQKPEIIIPDRERQTILEWNNPGESIVCYTSDFSTIKIYNTKSDSFIDGFTDAISKRINNDIDVLGYYFMYLKDFIDKYPNIPLYESYKYTEITVGKLKSHKNPIPIVCYKLDSFEVVKIYSDYYETEQDGFHRNSVVSACTGDPNKTQFTSQHIYANYRWMKKEEFAKEHQDEINKYLKRITDGNPPKINPHRFCHEVCRCDENYDIIKVYKSIGQVREDGLFHQNVYRVLTRDKKKGTRSWYNNSYWIKAVEYMELFPEKWEKYNNLLRQNKQQLNNPGEATEPGEENKLD